MTTRRRSWLRRFEHLTGERLLTAILVEVIRTDAAASKCILEFLTGREIEAGDEPNVQPEHPTSSDDEGQGFIDILVKSKQVVVGIECKLFAPLYDEQPFKYAQTIVARGAGLDTALVLLVPAGPALADARRRVADRPLQSRERGVREVDRLCAETRVVTWEGLLEALAPHRAIDGGSDGEATWLLKELDAFYGECTDLFSPPGGGSPAADVVWRWQESEHRAGLLDAIRRLIPQDAIVVGDRIGASDWIGHNVSMAGTATPGFPARGFIGFVRNSRYGIADGRPGEAFTFVMCAPSGVSAAHSEGLQDMRPLDRDRTHYKGIARHNMPDGNEWTVDEANLVPEHWSQADRRNRWSQRIEIAYQGWLRANNMSPRRLGESPETL